MLLYNLKSCNMRKQYLLVVTQTDRERQRGSIKFSALEIRVLSFLEFKEDCYIMFVTFPYPL